MFYDLYSEKGLQVYWDDLGTAILFKFASFVTLLTPIPVWQMFVDYPADSPSDQEDDYIFWMFYFWTPAGHFMKFYCYFSANCNL